MREHGQEIKLMTKTTILSKVRGTNLLNTSFDMFQQTQAQFRFCSKKSAKTAEVAEHKVRCAKR